MTQCERVLARLRAGGTDLTEWPAGFRLASRVHDLRAAGHPVTSRMIRLPGTGTRAARYELAPWACAQCGTPADPIEELLGGVALGHCRTCRRRTVLRRSK